MLSVITAADSYDLVALTTVKSELGIAGPDEDDKLRRHIAQASDAIAKACNRMFPLETIVETFRRSASYVTPLALARYPVMEIVSVVENDDAALNVSAYELDARSGLLTRLNDDRETYWPRGRLVVTYRAGFAEIPDAIERAAVLLVGRFRSTGGGDLFLRSVSIDGIESRTHQDYPDGGVLPSEVESLISAFRKPAGG